MSFYSINAHASILNEERTEYVGSEGGAFEGASWHAGKLTRGFIPLGQATPSQIDEDQEGILKEPNELRRPPLDSRCHPELAGLVAGARRNDLRRSKGFRAFQGRSRARQ